MRAYLLRINIVHLKSSIDKNYFFYRDMFYRMLVFNVREFNKRQEGFLGNFVLDDCTYNCMFSSGMGYTELLESVNSPENMTIMLDMYDYIQEFLNRKYDYRFINVMGVDIYTNELIICLKLVRMN